jgi:hypothetical protein
MRLIAMTLHTIPLACCSPGLTNRSGSGGLTVDVTTVVTLPFALEVDGVVIVARADAQRDAAIFLVGFIKLCSLFGNAPADARR